MPPNSSEAQVLAYILRAYQIQEPPMPSRISDELKLSRSAVFKALGQLEKMGCIRRAYERGPIVPLQLPDGTPIELKLFIGEKEMSTITSNWKIQTHSEHHFKYEVGSSFILPGGIKGVIKGRMYQQSRKLPGMTEEQHRTLRIYELECSDGFVRCPNEAELEKIDALPKDPNLGNAEEELRKLMVMLGVWPATKRRSPKP